MEKHKSALREILRRHKIWVESDGEKGERLDLSGADLRKARFDAAVIDDASMRGVSLRDTDLSGSDWAGTKTGEWATDTPAPRFRAHRALHTKDH